MWPPWVSAAAFHFALLLFLDASVAETMAATLVKLAPTYWHDAAAYLGPRVRIHHTNVSCPTVQGSASTKRVPA